MNAHRYRIAASTIIEMMVALVLTALAISFIYAGYRYIQRQGNGVTQHLLAFGEVDRFYRALQADNLAADEIRYGSYGIDFGTGEAREVVYLVADSLCIRQTGQATDTFRVQLDSLVCWLADERQETERGLVDACYFYLHQNGKPVPLVVRKTYDAAARTRFQLK